jgi:hypothetical protein
VNDWQFEGISHVRFEVDWILFGIIFNHHFLSTGVYHAVREVGGVKTSVGHPMILLFLGTTLCLSQSKVFDVIFLYDKFRPK